MKLYYNVLNVLEYCFIRDVIFIERGNEIMSKYNRILHRYIRYYKEYFLGILINYKIRTNESFILMGTLL